MLNITFVLGNIIFLFITQRGLIISLISQVILLLISFPKEKLLKRMFLREDVIYT